MQVDSLPNQSALPQVVLAGQQAAVFKGLEAVNHALNNEDKSVVLSRKLQKLQV